MDRNLFKYFERQSDFKMLIRSAELLSALSFSHVCVVPARSEVERLPHLVSSLEIAARGFSPLMILVLNSCEDSELSEISEQQTTEDSLVKRFSVSSRCGDLLLLMGGSLSILVIDRWSKGRQFLTHQGVGTARKIGCDVATFLQTNGIVRCPFVLSTDADARVPEDYFSALDQISGEICLAYYAFKHAPEGSDQQKLAMSIYEQWIHHYVDSLKVAGSVFAVPALGSIYAIHCRSYIQVRGFPERKAGEDFYLMNKLLKVGRSQKIQTQDPIELSGRLSNRVPFGTGPTLSRWSQIENLHRERVFYNPQSFLVLRDFLNLERSIDPRFLPLSLLELRDQFLDRHPRRFHDRFDALKTLKLIHHLRDHHFGNLSLEDLRRLSKAA